MMHDRRTERRRVLQLVTHDRLGGVRTVVTMVESGLRSRGFVVDTLPLTTERGGLSVCLDLWRVAKAILTGRYDAVFTYQAAASVLGNAVAWLARVPTRAAHQTAAPEAIRPHWKLLDRTLGSIGIYTHIISNSDATTRSFSSWPISYLDRFVLVPHGVDPLPPPQGETDWRAVLAIPAGAPLLVATGRLVAQKNHGVAIEALALLPGAHLAIAGDGPDETKLRSLAGSLGVASRLHLVGPVEREKLGDLLAASDVYLFPSVWETFGLAGVEAAMTGLPIVAADLPVLREVLDTGSPEMVRFHAPHNAAQLADAVRAFLENYAALAVRRIFAERHHERHGVSRMIEQYSDFLLTAKVR